MSKAVDEYQRSLWSHECTSCRLSSGCDYALLGAGGCACLCRGQTDVLSGAACRHICREPPATFGAVEQHIEETTSLDELRIAPELPRLRRLPAWLPLRTHEAKRRIANVSVAAVELKYLQLSIRDPTRMLRCALPRDTMLLAILNADDKMLERLWKAGAEARAELFRQLTKVGFVGCTGPTFSILHDVTERLPYHNEISLRRHHRILQEIADMGLVPIPNLYTTGLRSTAQIAAWLNEHPQIELVSRDFSMTRTEKAFASEYQGLCDLLSQVARPRQVLLPGVSMKRAEFVMRGLGRLGHSVSLVTGDPILKAIHGVRLSVDTDGLVSWTRSRESRAELIGSNIESALRYLEGLRLVYCDSVQHVATIHRAVTRHSCRPRRVSEMT